MKMSEATNYGVRHQYTQEQYELSRATGIDCSDDPGPTRQEFKDEADINILLSKFGINQQSRPLQYGDQDLTIDLQQALIAVDESKKGYNKLSREMRDAFPTWQKFVNGIATGEVAQFVQKTDAERAARRERIEVEKEVAKEATRAQVLRDQEAQKESDRIRRGDPKPEEKPKTNT